MKITYKKNFFGMITALVYYPGGERIRYSNSSLSQAELYETIIKLYTREYNTAYMGLKALLLKGFNIPITNTYEKIAAKELLRSGLGVGIFNTKNKLVGIKGKQK